MNRGTGYGERGTGYGERGTGDERLKAVKEVMVRFDLKQGDKEIMMEIREFRDLNIWKLGMSIVMDIYHLTKSFQKDELFELTSQRQEC